MFKKIIESFTKKNGHKHRRSSSSSRSKYSHKAGHYGHKHYKKGHKKSFFSSRSSSSS